MKSKDHRRKLCVGCVHYRPIKKISGAPACHYIIDAGEPRGCPPDRCDKRAEKLLPPVGINLFDDPNEVDLQRGKRCGEHERAIFQQGRINVLPTGKPIAK